MLYGLGLSWKILQKNNLHELRSVESNSRSIEPGSLILDRSSLADLHSKFCRTLDSNFTHKHTLSKSKTRLKRFDHGLPTLHNEVLIHLNIKS